jgi:hypothetical protein
VAGKSIDPGLTGLPPGADAGVGAEALHHRAANDANDNV